MSSGNELSSSLFSSSSFSFQSASSSLVSFSSRFIFLSFHSSVLIFFRNIFFFNVFLLNAFYTQVKIRQEHLNVLVITYNSAPDFFRQSKKRSYFRGKNIGLIDRNHPLPFMSSLRARLKDFNKYDQAKK